MNEIDALKLVQKYITGWKENNLDQIIQSLTEDCLIIESHGPTYEGISAIKCWFELWLAANSYVTQWDITSFYFCDKQETAFCEWEFACISHDQEYTLPGISVIKFSNTKISYLHEYRMTHAPYIWKREKLAST
jgi:hypothetical protein